MKKWSFWLAAVAVTLAGHALPASAQVTLQGGDLIKMAGSASVYYFGHDGRRYVFPNDKTYLTWYANFNAVKTILPDQLSGIMIGGNVTYKPGARMVKVATNSQVYAVSKNGILRPIASEGVAAALYGSNWNRMIDDVPDAFFTNYRVGAAIATAGAYDKAALASGVPSISVDKLQVNPPAGFVDVRQTIGFSPASVEVSVGQKVTWIVLDESQPRVASNPHPSHNDVPGLDSNSLGMGETFSSVFPSAGTKGYHNHNFTSMAAQVVVR